MLDVRPPALLPGQGERLAREVYKREFRRRDAEVRGRDSWKLERRQHFEERGSASRDALRRGDLAEALRLLEQRRESLLRAAEEDERRGSFFHRVRVVEEPFTPYMRWELHSLRLRAECGERVRVIDAEEIRSAETEGPLPELVVLGGAPLYQVLYTESGIPDGAVRYTDRGLVESWETYIKELYRTGEEMLTYFERKLAQLLPPTKAE